jgi:hypothetical protein
MRYERPELTLLGDAAAIVLGGPQMAPAETVDSYDDQGLFGYDESHS